MKWKSHVNAYSPFKCDQNTKTNIHAHEHLMFTISAHTLLDRPKVEFYFPRRKWKTNNAFFLFIGWDVMDEILLPSPTTENFKIFLGYERRRYASMILLNVWFTLVASESCEQNIIRKPNTHA